MTIDHQQGPIVASGQNPGAQTGQPPQAYNQDRAPNIFDLGVGVIDPRFGFKTGGAGGGSPLAFCFPSAADIIAVDQVPSTLASANIAALANAASGVPMTLVAATGAGITVMTAALTIFPTGKVVPACLAIDGLPGFVTFGQTKAIQAFDPTKAIARAVSVTGVVNGTGGNFTVAGYDIYGFPQTEVIAAGAGVSTVNGKKAFKFIQSVTPAFTDAHTYSVGTTDIYGFPIRVDRVPYAMINWNSTGITASTGFVAADTTNPATTTTGDVRGTYAVQTASDGAKRLFIEISPTLANLAALTYADVSGLFGVTPV